MKIAEIPSLFGSMPLFLVVTDKETYNVRAVNEKSAQDIIKAVESRA